LTNRIGCSGFHFRYFGFFPTACPRNIFRAANKINTSGDDGVFAVGYRGIAKRRQSLRAAVQRIVPLKKNLPQNYKKFFASSSSLKKNFLSNQRIFIR